MLIIIFEVAIAALVMGIDYIRNNLSNLLRTEAAHSADVILPSLYLKENFSWAFGGYRFLMALLKQF